MKIAIAAILLVGLTLSTWIYVSRRRPAVAPVLPPVVSQAQVSDFAEVAVTVTPLVVSPKQNWEFQIALNTHISDQTTDLMASAVLLVANKEYKPLAWDGDPPGGHHRSGRLIFAPPEPAATAYALKLRLDGESEDRIFSWPKP